MATASGITITGMKKVNGLLKQLPFKVQTRVTKKALRESAAPIVRNMRKGIRPHDRTGALRKSIGTRLKQLRGSDVAIIIVGPRRRFNKVSGVLPTKYAHLLERGFNHGGKKVKGVFWGRRALASGRTSVMKDFRKGRFVAILKESIKLMKAG